MRKRGGESVRKIEKGRDIEKDRKTDRETERQRKREAGCAFYIVPAAFQTDIVGETKRSKMLV